MNGDGKWSDVGRLKQQDREGLIGAGEDNGREDSRSPGWLKKNYSVGARERKG